ncbi:MAG TPA: iron-sulfur cluster carrier protein ApbC [Rhizomicrobium sp.]|nr:iron-sulfur cluster carrier protein ApbC [Rhizomicrobium sp.]
MPAATREDILAALDRITDPLTHKSVVEAGLIEGLVIKNGNVGFAIEVPAARGREAEPLRKACEDAVRALPGVLSVTAVLTAHQEPANARRAPQRPIQGQGQGGHSHGPGGHSHGPGGHSAQATSNGIPGVANVIAVASGKGGVGKSTVAVNLALGLARLGLKVGLLDADIYGPSVPRLLAITEKPKAGENQKLQPIEKLGIKAMSIGFLINEDEPMIWRGPMVQSALTQMMNDVLWAPLDVLVIDMPPGTGDAQLTIAQRVPLKGAVIVSTPQDIALIDARKGLAMFNKTKVPVLGIVENMSVFICPNCGHETHIFSHGGARQTAEKLDVPFLGEIPLVPIIRETSDAGTPIVAAQPGSAEAQAFMTVANAIVGALKAPARSAPKIVME